MKLALFNDHRIGLVRGDRIFDVSDIAGSDLMALLPAQRMPALMERFEALRPALEAVGGEGAPLAAAHLRAPLPRPGKILCAIGNYMEGVREIVLPLGMFLKASSAVLDPGGTVVLPRKKANMFQHEAELCVVIGKRGRDVPVAEAMDYVFGYTCIMDVSARGLTRVGATGWYVDKSYDTFAPLGPVIATRDEVPDPQKLGVKLWVDGVLRQNYNTDDMEHPVSELVAWASEVATLEPGDILACGTNHQGLGPIQDGETLAMEIEHVGRLTVQVSDPEKRSWPKGVDPEFAKIAKEHRERALAAKNAAAAPA
jgi:2-keto-4-pentenoate hydratase/2-oxohepta-3-ene-1,7-dioic acid hydratase in catechol pathway